MRTILTTVLAVALAAGVAFTQGKGKGGGAPGGAAKGKGGPSLTLTTTAFPDGGIVPDKFTQNVPMPVSPALTWSNVPANTQSFVLHMHDPDVAIGRNTTDVIHWIVWNIPGTATGLPENVPAVAQGPDGMMQGMNQGNVAGYRGPGAPAAGPPHHYTWELFALDTKLDLPATATRDDVIKAVNGHINGKAVLVGRFIRSN
ncbi:MAG: YbhB/YbcL family Raf kinase inhibitor-like protein [Acidobacteriota bacterium]